MQNSKAAAGAVRANLNWLGFAKLVIVLGILLIISVKLTQAATYEVGAGRTFPTIQACNNTATGGDICNIHAGSYTEVVSVSKSITFQNNAGESPIITGGFSVDATPNVTIRCNNGGGAMEIKGYGTSSVGAQGIFQYNGTGLTVTGCRIHDGYGTSIYSRNSTKLILNDNQAYRNFRPSAGRSATGITVISGHSTDGTYANGMTITNNDVYDNDVDGLDIHGQYFTVSGNTIYDNITSNWATTHPDGIQLIAATADAYTSVQHARIFSNTVKNSTQLIFTEGTRGGASSNCEDIWIYNNVLYTDSGAVNGVNMDTLSVNQIVLRNSKDVRVYNNTFGRSKGNAIYAFDGADNSITIKNNVFANNLGQGVYIPDTAQIPSGGLNHNIYNVAGKAVWWGTAYYTTVATFRTAVPNQEMQGLDGNPLLNAFPIPTLRSGSPGISVGLDLSTAFTIDKNSTTRTNPWDLGAYQYSGSNLPAPASPTNLRVQ